MVNCFEVLNLCNEKKNEEKLDAYQAKTLVKELWEVTKIL
jgi:hypothetical protein